MSQTQSLEELEKTVKSIKTEEQSSDVDQTVIPETGKCVDGKCSPYVWMFIVIAIVILIIFYVVTIRGMSFFKTLKQSVTTKYMWIWGVIVGIAFLVMSYYAFVGYSLATSYTQFGIFIAFIAVSLLLLGWAFAMFTMKELYSAVWVSVALLFAIIILMYLCWSSNTISGLGNLGMGIVGLIIVGFSYRLYTMNTEI